MTNPQKGFYYHYKHNSQGAINNYAYEVVGVAKNTEDGTLSVLYRPLYENEWIKPADLFSRPLDMFIGEAKDGDKSVPRFAQITDQSIISQLESFKKDKY